MRDISTLGGLEKIPGAADVRIVNVLLAFGPQAIIGGNVKHTRGAGKRASKRRRVPQITGDVFEWQIGDRAIVAGRPQENANGLAAGDELPRHMAAKKSRSTGYERRHCSVAFLASILGARGQSSANGDGNCFSVGRFQ